MAIYLRSIKACSVKTRMNSWHPDNFSKAVGQGLGVEGTSHPRDPESQGRKGREAKMSPSMADQLTPTTEEV